MELGSLRNRRLHWGIGLLVLPLVGALWVQRASLDAGKVPEISQRIPVIFVPGVTGVRLRDEATGRGVVYALRELFRRPADLKKCGLEGPYSF